MVENPTSKVRTLQEGGDQTEEYQSQKRFVRSGGCGRGFLATPKNLSVTNDTKIYVDGQNVISSLLRKTKNSKEEAK